MMAGSFHPPFSFRSCRKENGPWTVQKKRTLRRVGPHGCGPPAAGGGWLAVPCGSQGRKRAALGVTFGPGRSGIHPAPLFAAAGRSAQEPVQRADEGFGPYGDTVGPVHFLWGPICVSALARVTKATSPVGSDALVRPPAQAATTARAARSAAERAEGGTSGTLVTEILGAPQRETVKEKLVKCSLAPRPKTHPAAGISR